MQRLTGLSGWGMLSLLLLMLLQPCQAGVYRWQDQDGRVHFGDRPPAESTAEPMELQQINSYSAPEIIQAPDGPALKGSKPRVVIYSASWCGVCKQAKAYFKAKHIPYREYDVETSSKGRRDFKRLEGHGVPIILVGESRMNGFSVAGFEALYQR